ncbi:hypothetical protein H257_08204 [Aphanomyces astaci]|uniref:Homeobox domain-containing protein n=1 Tax=Aphanomyces astaci TaxID=112090 RepID=W4GG80_APHAT|nr:hypothetical protein H257_08204 [Aphanomyces astaci]ETV77978.1 hypothetical protein H257_08204 [Aphanomyces astaci]RQM29887.1 hypothetical protein B5M09_000932 [Aphanomyces astaci]|eukprot:XP_009832315.1 hypothetical protein H257_08204 [Aphanomyces astaci]
MERDETPMEDGDDMDVEEMFGSDSPSSGSDSDAPLRPAKVGAAPQAKQSVASSPADDKKVASTQQPSAAPGKTAAPLTTDSTVSNVPATDDEASEDNDHELATWAAIDMQPAIDLIDKLAKTCVDAAKDFNASVVSTTHQLVSGCDSVLLEIKHISDIRDSMKRKAVNSAHTAPSSMLLASHALGTSMLPASSSTSAPPQSFATAPAVATPPSLDKGTEDQTDRVLYKIEASIEKFRELAEMIQTTSMHHEALLVHKLHLPPSSIETMVTSIHNAAAAATSAAIAQVRHRMPRTLSPEQRTKLQTWYYSYPRPLADELDLMSSILSYPPYSTSCSLVHPQHVRDWFKRRRFRERMRLVVQAVEASSDPASPLSLHAAEASVRARMELRIQTLREAVNPDELVRELEHVRLSSSLYSNVASSFGHKRNLDQFLAAAHHAILGGASDKKKPRLQVPGGAAASSSAAYPAALGVDDVDDAIVVKVASKFELEAIQRRLQTLLQAPKTTANTNNIQQAMDVLRSLDISNELMQSTGVVADLKRVLKVYKKPSLLRRTTEALMESLGQTTATKKPKRPAAPPPPPPMVVSVAASSPLPPTALVSAAGGEGKTTTTSKRKKGAKLLRPMKFSMQQVEALETWFQKTFKPSQSEMEEYLDALNAEPLRDPKQTVDVNMTQLRRWFNKRRCLRRPPFALMTTKDKKDDDDDMGGTPDDYDEDEVDDDDDGGMATSHVSSTGLAGGALASEDDDQASSDDSLSE